MSDSAITTWDFTLSKEYSNFEEIKKILVTKSRAWCFQLESGEETGYEHFQGRFILKERLRLTGVKKFWPKETHLSPTSNENRNNMFYVQKENTRIDGPWSDEDIEIPKWLQVAPDWYPYQRSILRKIKDEANTRVVNVLVDTEGNNGKSFLSLYLAVRKLARRLPMLNDARDMSRMILDSPKSNCYFIDLPRATDKKFMHNFIAAMEELKNGYAFDDRYSFREEFFNPPHIWIFTNAEIDPSLLSKGRWKLWYLDDNLKLKRGIKNINIAEVEDPQV